MSFIGGIFNVYGIRERDNMFRNTGELQHKIVWPVNEQDASETLSLISYCHRRLDKAQRVE